jgi:cob(I)alamin adenosyltransferase
VRITRVYTKTGDGGETSLVDGSRVGKDALRVSTFGDVDELNSVLGLARSWNAEPEINEILELLQNDLFTVGADLATPMGMAVPRVDEERVEKLEGIIDRLLEELEPLKEFILPSGTQVGACLHLARSVARRAERLVVSLARSEETNPQVVIYLNRISDLLFVLARVANKRAGVRETPAVFSSRSK